MKHYRNAVPTLAAALIAAGATLLPAVPARAQKAADETLKSFKVADGLEATLWAAEPMFSNPTNIDIDEKGRIWVAEAANYRGSKTRPEGDRIVILEDTDLDGKADKSTVFVQDPMLFAPLGVAKIGDKLYVSQSPNVFVYTIDESDGGDPKPAGKPEVLFTGFGGVNHDHGVHAIIPGPDGLFYFNAGNDGGGDYVKDAQGQPIVDRTNSEVGAKSKTYRGKPKGRDNVGYRQGLAFRFDPANPAKTFEVLGYNFRNNYELTTDAFGTVWQSDNDDDGNLSVRINYVMEGGNFGFTGPTGSNWGRDMEKVPGQTKQEAHWHLRWPGVVPNLLHTGGGSPTGITLYEGDLLPEKFRGAMIHCDAGPNVVRAYIPKPSGKVPTGLMDKGQPVGPDEGAGYEAEFVELIKASDSWFRPADVCVAPDGSLFIADWYDPGVGGHATGDKPPQLRGRIYRLAPPGHKATMPKLDLGSVQGQVEALKNPNFNVRYLAHQKLRAGGEQVAKALKELWSGQDARLRARALWLLARTPEGKDVVRQALKDPNHDIRVAAFRAARLIGMDVPALAKELANDAHPFLRREAALAMRYEPDDAKAIPVLVALADKYDGKDRWYLEALGIGAEGRETAVLEAWKTDGTNKDPQVAEKLAWRLTFGAPLPASPAAQAPADATPAAAAGTATDVQAAAPLDFPPQTSKDGKVLASPTELAKLTGDAKAGAAVFRNANGANCISCHQIGDEGKMLGPPLSTVGQKLSRDQLYQAILYPSSAILMSYESWVVKTKKGEVVTGLKVEDTPDHITIKDTKLEYHDIPAEEVQRAVKQPISIMPEGLSGTMTAQDLVDLVEYLTTLRNQV